MIYRFGPFRYDAAQRLLFRGAELVPLVPKALDTLHVLLERRGVVVEKSDLMSLVWPDTNVEEVGLARNISLLRKALEDTGEGDSYIETIPRRGYRFAAPVATDEPAGIPPAPPPGEPPAPPPRMQPPLLRWRLVALVVCAAAAAALIYYQFYVPSRYLPGGAMPASLAVIPFPCLCAGMDGDAFSQGLNEVLVADLAKLNAVQVVSPNTVRRHQQLGVSTGLMARLLDVAVLVEGTVQKREGGLRVTARLVDVHTGRLIWAETYDEPADPPGAAQDRLAQTIAREVGQRLKVAPKR